MELHSDVASLADLLRRIEAHLAANGEGRWTTAIDRCRASVEKADAWGLHSFLVMFGGMGSLNDLVLQRHGQVLVAENDELRTLLTEAWSLATKLKCEEAGGGFRQTSDFHP